jgi:hypothetical protein
LQGGLLFFAAQAGNYTLPCWEITTLLAPAFILTIIDNQ